MKHTLSVIVENNAGVLTRVAGLFSRRGYNIESLTVGTTDLPGISRMTIVVDGDERIIEQVSKQLYKLIEVQKLIDLTEDEYIDREVVLIKVAYNNETRTEILQIVDIFRAHVVDFSKDTFIVETTGDSSKINAIEEALKPFGIRETIRTGKVALSRGQR